MGLGKVGCADPALPTGSPHSVEWMGQGMVDKVVPLS